jgi:hypothetical protein
LVYGIKIQVFFDSFSPPTSGGTGSSGLKFNDFAQGIVALPGNSADISIGQLRLKLKHISINKLTSYL